MINNKGGNMKKSILLRVSEDIKKRMEEAAKKENRRASRRSWENLPNDGNKPRCKG